MTEKQQKQFASFSEFYPFYLTQHANKVCKGLHVVGLISALSILFIAIMSGRYGFILLAPVVGYSCSWVGHFVFEKNKPATFGYPLYSLMGDFRMVWDVLSGRHK